MQGDGDGPISNSDRKEQIEAARYEKELVLREETEKRKARLTYLVSVIGMFVAVTFFIVQFYEIRLGRSGFDFSSGSSESSNLYNKLIDSQQQQIRLLEEQIRELQDQIKQLKNTPNRTQFYPEQRFLKIIPVQLSAATQGASKEPLSRNLPVFKEYILPCIYALLGIILFCSAIFSISTKDKPRRDVAVEITKTLITFFIGAATGQA